MPTGIVKWFNTAKGYGFITPEDNSRDVFVHISSLERSNNSSIMVSLIVLIVLMARIFLFMEVN